MIAEKDLQHIAAHCRPVWGELRGKAILVTGGTGFFGKWMLESFAHANETMALNATMLVLSRDPDKFVAAHPQFGKACFRYVQGDITSFVVPNGPVDLIIHAATDMSGYGQMQQATRLYDSIVDGTRRVLELAKERGTTSVLHTGSGAVYGVQPPEITHIAEDYKGAPDIYGAGAAYGEGKRVAEMLANIYYHNHGVPSKIARCFAFIGPYVPMDGSFAAGNFIKAAVEGKDIVIAGDGRPHRSYLYAADLAIWLWNILLRGENMRPYNVGSDEEVTIEELARLIAAQSATGKTQVQVLTPRGNQPAQRYVPSVQRAKEELNLSIHTNLADAVKRTMEFYTV